MKRIVVILMTLFLGAVHVEAQTESADTPLAPYFVIVKGDSQVDHMPLQSTDVKVHISGVIAEAMVTQTYQNKGERPIHARYVFPASTRAAVHGMQMRIGERVITARIEEKKKAAARYETARRQGKNASLLEQKRPNVFRMQIANIMPGDTIEVTLRYSELLLPQEGIYSFVFPTVVGPRYSTANGETTDGDNDWVRSPYLPANIRSKAVFSISGTLSAGMPIEKVKCSTHPMDIRWSDKSRCGFSLAGDGEAVDRDFELNYQLTGGQIQSGLLLHQGQEENFFLLMMQPPKQVTESEVVAREYLFVVDVSGSMHGFPIQTAKSLMGDLIQQLTPNDYFNLVLFAGDSRVMARQSMAATADNLKRAIGLLDGEKGGGGTELVGALQRCLAIPKRKTHARTIVVVTDGYVSAEKGIFWQIADNLDQANLFAFGIGSSVNRYLIEGMAKAGMGEPFIVTRPEEAPMVADRFCRYIQSPILTDLQLQANGFEIYDVEPPALPDLFVRRPLIVFGKWKGEQMGQLRVNGRQVHGRYEKIFAVDPQKGPTPAHGALRYLWARGRLSRISDFALDRKNADRKGEILSLGLTYELLTAYTSFVAVNETVRNPEAKGHLVDQPLALPKGVSNLAVGGGVVNVPEPEFWVVLLTGGCICLLGHWRRHRRKGTEGCRRPSDVGARSERLPGPVIEPNR